MNARTAGTVAAGFGSADITPWEGVQLAGAAMGEARPARFVRRPLYAKAAVFRGKKTVCMIGLDVICVTTHYSGMIRDRIAEKYEIDREAIMVFAIQSHSAPSVGEVMLDQDFPIELPPELKFITGSNEAYAEFAVEGALRAADDAFSSVRPLKMDVKSGTKHGLAFCRRLVMRNGVVEMWPLNSAKANPLGPDILYPESPADDEVGVVCFKDEKMKMAGALLHFTAHPVCDFCTPSLYHAVSPDWCGVWSERLQEKLGFGTIPMVMNGSCGNINPYDPYAPDFVMDSVKVGSQLADLAERIILSMEFAGADAPLEVDFRSFEVPIDYRNVPEERVREVEEILADGKVHLDENGNAGQEWFEAASTCSALCEAKREGRFMYPVQIFKIGSLALVSMAGEPFTDGQLQIKLHSKAAYTYVTHMANKYIGYIPAKKAYVSGGYETHEKYTYWTKVAPGSLEKICDRIIEELNSFF